MLAVSVLAMLASGGLTWLAAAGWIVLTACRTATASAAAHRAIVVLGHRLEPDGAPSHAFRARLGRAASLWRAAPETGRAVLLAQGVPGGCIHAEMRSRHTLENLRSPRAALAEGPRTPVTLMTSRPHLAPARLMARGMGIACKPCAAEPGLDGPALAAVSREAFLLHWYVTGRSVAWLLNNQKLASRVT